MLTGVIHGTSYCREPMFGSLAIHICPYSTTANGDDVILSINCDGVQPAKVDDKTTPG